MNNNPEDISKPMVHNIKPQEICKDLDRLSDEEQQMVIVFLDSLIKRDKFSEILREQLAGLQDNLNNAIAAKEIAARVPLFYFINNK